MTTAAQNNDVATTATTTEVIIEKKSKAPILTCLISGLSRKTSRQYLEEKAVKLKLSVEDVCANYINKTVCKDLRKGKSLSDLNPDIQLTDERLKQLVLLNSKCVDDFTFENGVYKAIKTNSTSKPKTIADEEAELQEETSEKKVKAKSEKMPAAKKAKKSVKQAKKDADSALDEIVKVNKQIEEIASEDDGMVAIAD
jgi:hypothetical protein